MLTLFTRRSTSRSGFLISIPRNEVVPIANIDSQQDGQTFSLEATITFSTDLKSLYVLVCSNYGQDVRYPTIREIDCMNCDQRNMLIPRCEFEIHPEDSSGSTIGLSMDKEAEKLLSLTVEEIYKRPSDLDKYAPMEDIQANFNKKLFFVRAKKAFARTSRTTSINKIIYPIVRGKAKLYSLSCIIKHCIYSRHGSIRT